MENLEIYEKSRSVPENAQKTIRGGKLKGFTDINPMWRIKKLTEIYGPCGLGWYTEKLKEWTQTGPDGRTAAFMDINLYVKTGEEWSKPIFGTGGSMFVNLEKDELTTSDECFKMAYTDAVSVACKSLGLGADIYWQNDRTKYNSEPKPDVKQTPTDEEILKCSKCGKKITVAEHDYSVKNYKRVLCRTCQKEARK